MAIIDQTAAIDPATAGIKDRYENFIGGAWVAPTTGEYRDNVTPARRSRRSRTRGRPTSSSRSTPPTPPRTPGARPRRPSAPGSCTASPTQSRTTSRRWRSRRATTTASRSARRAPPTSRWPPTTSATSPAIRGEEGAISEIDKDTIAYHFREPLGVVGQIIPFNFPLLMAAWKMAPAIAAGNCTVIKPASPTPWSILKFCELIEDIVPPGVINVVNGPGAGIGKALATNKRISKIAFTGETATGRLIMQYAAQNLIPSTTELGGKSPNIFFADVMEHDDAFLDKAIEGLVLFAFNKGEVCTAPSRALIHESIYDEFMERCLNRIRAISHGHPLDPATMLGAQVSTSQMEKIASYCQIGLDEGAELLIGGHAADLGGELEGGYYFEPTVFKGDNSMRIFQEEIFGPVLAVTTFADDAQALEIANDTLYGLGAGVWTRDMNRAYRMGRAIKAGRVWTNCYHQYPAHAAFGGYKFSGVGRENHKMMLDHYSQTKCLLVSYDENALGFF